MPRYRKSDVEMRGTRPALNVKCYRHPSVDDVVEHFKCSEGVAEKALQYAWESAQQRFWEDVPEWARNRWGGHVKVYSEGRSGGWLVVEGLYPVDSWDAIALARWAGFARGVQKEIDYLASWEHVREDIEANEWAKEGSELYNFLDLKDGRTVTMSELKNAHKPPTE